MQPRIRLLLAIASAITAGTITIAIAQTTPPSTPPATAPAAAPYQAGVQKVRLSLTDLRTVGLDLKNVLKATSSLYDEVTIQPMEIMFEPEVVGQGVIIQVPIGKRPTGPVEPARKDRVDLAMSHIKPTVQMFKTNVDSFVSGEKELDVPDAIHTKLQPDLNNWISGVQQLSKQETQLEQLTASSPYDQGTIAADCVAMQQNIKDLDETRRSIYKVLKKHAKELNISMQ
jgi:hypothetical protein